MVNNMIQKVKSKVYVTMHITGRCNIRCKHCFESSAIGGHINKVFTDAKREDVFNWLRQIAAAKCTGVSFVGGEPFLCLYDLIAYIKYAKELGLQTTVITNGYWAESSESVDKMLDELSGLDSIVVSSDKYHLEFIDIETVDNLVNGCIRKNVQVSIHVTAASNREGMEIKSLYTNRYSKPVQVLISPMFIWDSPHKIEVEKINFMEHPNLLKSHCNVNSPVVHADGNVHMCYGSLMLQTASKEFFKLGNLAEETYENMMKMRNESLLYQFMNKYGPSGLAKIIKKSNLKDKFSEMEFSKDCQMCVWALDNKTFCDYFVDLLEKSKRTI